MEPLLLPAQRFYLELPMRVISRSCLFYLDTDNASVRPLIDLVPNFLFRDVVWPAHTFIGSDLDLILTAKTAEVRAGGKQARPNGFAGFDQVDSPSVFTAAIKAGTNPARNTSAAKIVFTDCCMRIVPVCESQ
jgi:hypothetical protein